MYTNAKLQSTTVYITVMLHKLMNNSKLSKTCVYVTGKLTLTMLQLSFRGGSNFTILTLNGSFLLKLNGSFDHFNCDLNNLFKGIYGLHCFIAPCVS